MIPEALVDGEVMNKEKIRQMYDWALGFEERNPQEKKFVHFALMPAKGDSIIIMQHDGNNLLHLSARMSRILCC